MGHVTQTTPLSGKIIHPWNACSFVVDSRHLWSIDF